jgi:TonB family protein
MLPVHSVDGVVPEVRVHGKLKHAPYAKRLAMRRVPAFCDGFVEYVDKNFQSFYGDINNELRIRAVLRSDRDFKDCYLVVVFARQEDAGGSMLAAEVPDLDAGQKVQFKVRLAISEQMTHWQYFIHLYSGEREILTSDRTNSSVLGRRARVDSAMLERARDSAPMVLYRLAPRRPDGFDDSASGTCTLRFTIGTNGEPSNISVVSATRPEIGESAADALEQWVFRPAIENHQFVPTTIDYPFTLPPKSGN